MGDTALAQDIIDGVKDALEEVGHTCTFRITTYAEINPLAPGAAPVATPTNVSVEAFLFDFDIKWMPDSSVEKGSTLALLDITGFTTAHLAGLVPGNFLVDGSTTYTIAKVAKIKVAGVVSAAILQLED